MPKSKRKTPSQKLIQRFRDELGLVIPANVKIVPTRASGSQLSSGAHRWFLDGNSPLGVKPVCKLEDGRVIAVDQITSLQTVTELVFAKKLYIYTSYASFDIVHYILVSSKSFL